MSPVILNVDERNDDEVEEKKERKEMQPIGAAVLMRSEEMGMEAYECYDFHSAIDRWKVELHLIDDEYEVNRQGYRLN